MGLLLLLLYRLEWGGGVGLALCAEINKQVMLKIKRLTLRLLMSYIYI